MLLLLDEDVKLNLKLLSDLEPDVVTGFCRLAGNFLLKGINKKKYASIASKLSLEESDVGKCLESLMFILHHSARNEFTEEDFHESLLKNDILNEDSRNALSEWYGTNKDLLRELISQMKFEYDEIPRYVNMEWRFEAQLASRALRDQLKPNIILRFEFYRGGNKTEFVTLQCDPANLIHMRDVFEKALSEARSQHLKTLSRQNKSCTK